MRRGGQAARSESNSPRARATSTLRNGCAIARSRMSIGGDAAWDPDFNTADLFMLLRIARMSVRYAKQYMAEAA